MKPQTIFCSHLQKLLKFNNITEILDTTILSWLVQLKVTVTVNVVTGSKILNQYDCDTYFISVFPTIFPYRTGKHQDARRE